MRRELVLGTLIAAGGLTLAVAASQQPTAGGAQQPAPMVIEVEKLRDNVFVLRAGAATRLSSSRRTA